MNAVNESGFSLPELLATLAIAAIIVALAAPSMKATFNNHQIAIKTEQLYGSIMLARSEAIKRSKPVSLCRLNSEALCANNGRNWNVGWLVFADQNSNGRFDPEDQKIKIYPPFALAISINWNRGSYLRLNNRGQSKGCRHVYTV